MTEARAYLTNLLGSPPSASQIVWLERLASKWKLTAAEAHARWMREANGGRHEQK
jgi:hypothetical protein